LEEDVLTEDTDDLDQGCRGGKRLACQVFFGGHKFVFVLLALIILLVLLGV
jgi:hypothetical protein